MKRETNSTLKEKNLLEHLWSGHFLSEKNKTVAQSISYKIQNIQLLTITVCVCVQVLYVCVYLDKSWMSGSARRCHPAARQSSRGQRKSLVWGHSYTPRFQSAPGWADGLSSPLHLNRPPRHEDTDSLSYLVLLYFI